MNSKEAAFNAETILFSNRNTQQSIEWLRSIGLDAPDFPARCLHAAEPRKNLFYC